MGGLRGGIEGFSAAELAFVTSAYFLGLLSGARITPAMIRSMAHLRIFAATAVFAAYRMTRRAGIPASETESYLGILPTTSPVAAEAATAWSAEQAEAERDTNDAPH
jgi:hypothetical protein